MSRNDGTIEMCSEELKQHYMHCNDTLKIALPPSTQSNIHSVENLHVQAVLKKFEISPDRPQMQKIKAQELFESPRFKKKRILLFGPSGVGKTTEIKMWLSLWCQKNEGPLKKFTLVFYIDGLKIEKGSGLGQAIKTQCLPANKSFTPEVIENMCEKYTDEILVVLDHYTKWNRSDQPSGRRNTSTLEDMVLLQEYRHLTVLVALKSGGIGDFREVYGNYDHVKVEGIDTTLVATYIDKVFEERKEFGLKVKEYIENTELLRDMVASPVLLCIMCQILKWVDNPTSLGKLKTSSALIEKSIHCVMRHADPCLNTEPKEHSSSSPTSLRSNNISQTRTRPTLSNEETIKYLSVVAFNSYLKDGQQEELYLCERDFDVCGDLKTDVLTEGRRTGLLVQSLQEEFIPSYSVACEGKIYSFLNATFQQRLAAKRFSELLHGNDEEKKSFDTSLKKIGSMDEALSLRNLMQFSCGESIDAARTIIRHMVDLTLDFAKVVGLNAKEGESITWRADHVLYQDMVESILESNYESRSNGRLNDVLHPLVKRLQILSPSDILTRSLAYFLEHVVDPLAPPTDEFKIEVLDVPRRMQDSLPKKNNVDYKYEETAPVSIQIEDSSPAGGSFQPTLTQTSIRKLSINVKGKKTARDRKPCAAAAKFKPPEPVTRPVIKEETTYSFPDISPPEDAIESETTLSFSVQHTPTIAKETKERFNQVTHRRLQTGKEVRLDYSTSQEALEATDKHHIIHLEEHGIDVRIPLNELHSMKDVKVEVEKDVPRELELKETEAIITFGLKMSLPGARFETPVKVTMPHSGVFKKPREAKIIIYHRKSDSENFIAYPSTKSSPRCDVRECDLDIYINHFSEFWIVALITWVFVGKRMICTPQVPVQLFRNRKHAVLVHVGDMKRKGGKVEDGYSAPFSGDQFLFCWRSGGLNISFPQSTSETKTKTIPERCIRYLTDQKVMFELDTRNIHDADIWLKFILEQSNEILKEIIFPMTLHEPPQRTIIQCQEASAEGACASNPLLCDVSRFSQSDLPSTSSACTKPSPSPAHLKKMGTTDEIQEFELIQLAKNIPHDKYTEMANSLQITYAMSESILRSKNQDYKEAMMKMLTDWMNQQRDPLEARESLAQMLCGIQLKALANKISTGHWCS